MTYRILHLTNQLVSNEQALRAEEHSSSRYAYSRISSSSISKLLISRQFRLFLFPAGRASMTRITSLYSLYYGWLVPPEENQSSDIPPAVLCLGFNLLVLFSLHYLLVQHLLLLPPKCFLTLFVLQLLLFFWCGAWSY
jgi:hypothetical protein